jgi:hypothetical protein
MVVDVHAVAEPHLLDVDVQVEQIVKRPERLQLRADHRVREMVPEPDVEVAVDDHRSENR